MQEIKLERWRDQLSCGGQRGVRASTTGQLIMSYKSNLISLVEQITSKIHSE